MNCIILRFLDKWTSRLPEFVFHAHQSDGLHAPVLVAPASGQVHPFGPRHRGVVIHRPENGKAARRIIILPWSAAGIIEQRIVEGQPHQNFHPVLGPGDALGELHGELVGLQSGDLHLCDGQETHRQDGQRDQHLHEGKPRTGNP
jgi:hypothetical protein